MGYLIQNQKVINIDSERNLIMVQGGIPGAPSSYVVITPAIKAKGGVNGA